MDSPWAPLRHSEFRLLWGVTAASGVCLWMHDVAAGWLMTGMTSSPAMVALVQSAATLPIFLLGLPAGALADLVDRHRILSLVQAWTAVVALACCAALAAGVLSPWLLLALTFCNGLSLALRWPAVSALLVESVPRSEVSAAFGLNSIATNSSRIAAPMIAGALISALGALSVFVFNAIVAAISVTAILVSRAGTASPARASSEPFGSAIRSGLQFALHSRRVRAVLLRSLSFFVHGVAITALLPLVARRFPGAGATTYTLLLAAMGMGAVFSVAFVMPRIRDRLHPDRLLLLGMAAMAGAVLVVAYSPVSWLAAVAMVVAGAGWTTCANALTVVGQLSLPEWVRARGLAILLCTVMGGHAIGAAVWGQLASHTDITAALTVASLSGVAFTLALKWFPLPDLAATDVERRDMAFPPRAAVPDFAADGEVLVAIAYRIDPARTEDFLAVMEESRSSRLQRGARGWALVRDLDDAGRFVEYVTAGSWTEFERQVERYTGADAALRERRLAFHLGPEPPHVTRSAVQRRTRSLAWSVPV